MTVTTQWCMEDSPRVHRILEEEQSRDNSSWVTVAASSTTTVAAATSSGHTIAAVFVLARQLLRALVGIATLIEPRIRRVTRFLGVHCIRDNSTTVRGACDFQEQPACRMATAESGRSHCLAARHCIGGRGGRQQRPATAHSMRAKQSSRAHLGIP